MDCLWDSEVVAGLTLVRILYFAASSSEKNVAHSKDNTNSTHLKTAEMLKNIEIIDLVDLSPEVGRVL